MYDVKLIKKQAVAAGTMDFVFEKPDGFVFKPGQFVELNLVDSADGGRRRSRELSIVSAPSDDFLQFAMRMRESPFKKLLMNFSIGGEASIDGPFGSFFLHNDSSRPAVILAGGIGITPFMSMVRHATEAGLSHRILLLYSNRRPEDAAFLAELEGIARANKNFSFVPTMTDLLLPAENWAGRRGRISPEMIRELVPDLSRPVFYSAGPAGLVSAMRAILNSAGVDDDNIRTEEFTGY